MINALTWALGQNSSFCLGATCAALASRHQQDVLPGSLVSGVSYQALSACMCLQSGGMSGLLSRSFGNMLAGP